MYIKRITKNYKRTNKENKRGLLKTLLFSQFFKSFKRKIKQHTIKKKKILQFKMIENRILRITAFIGTWGGGNP